MWAALLSAVGGRGKVCERLEVVGPGSVLVDLVRRALGECCMDVVVHVRTLSKVDGKKETVKLVFTVTSSRRREVQRT
jgi:hypothetical protein